MPRIALLCILLLALTACSRPTDNAAENRSRIVSLKTLYDERKWNELAQVISSAGPADPFYRGATAVVLHQSPEEAEAQLRAAIQAAPQSDQAYEAYEWLLHLFLYSGQYRRFVEVSEERWKAFPNKPDIDKEKTAAAGFRSLPDQQTVSLEPSTLRHEPGSIFAPVMVNSVAASYFFDTGTWVSSIGEQEARRLKLRFTNAEGSTATMTNAASFRTAVADELTVGGLRLKNVSFLVFRDDQAPWSMLPLGRRGILGFPIILAFRTLRWAKDGEMRIGDVPVKFDAQHANLTLDHDRLEFTMTIAGRHGLGIVDTGAENTDLFNGLAQQFPELMASATEGTSEVEGIGGKATYKSATLPELAFQIGSFPALLRPAKILIERKERSYVGNFGMDVWGQGQALKIDFGAMRLEVEPR